jgi:hypothetical protein
MILENIDLRVFIVIYPLSDELLLFKYCKYCKLDFS